MDLTTRTRVRACFAIEQAIPATTACNDWLDARISEWSARAQVLLGRQVAFGTYTEYHDVRAGQQVFSLRAYPVSAIVSVVNDSSREYSSGTVDGDDYSCLTEAGVLRVDHHLLAPGPAALRVVYRGGMARTAASFAVAYPDIAGAMDAQIAYVWERRSSLGRTQVSVGPGSVSYTGAVDWLPHVSRLLLSYRRVRCG